MDQEKIGKFIAQCRKNKNITQGELAERLGVTNRSVSRWENGKNMPDYSILKELCNILEIDVNEFLIGNRIKKDEVKEHTNDNLDLILKEYYKMKKQKDKIKMITIISLVVIPPIVVAIITLIIFSVGFNNRLHVTTNLKNYNDVIGLKAKERYSNKWGMSEEIFPKTIENLNVKEFKMVCEDFLDEQYLAYLTVEYEEEDYNKEIKRLKEYGIDKYIGYYSVTGFNDYQLIAMEADDYSGFIYALTDGKNRIIYVEIIFCNYCMDIDYENEIPKEYLPTGFNAKEDNPYRKKLLRENK